MNTAKRTNNEILNIYRPVFVPLAENVTAAVFPLMKIFPAEFCLRVAMEEGLVRNETLIVETSSGNLALGLAIMCNLAGQRLTIVTDYACDPHLRRRLVDLGVQVEVVSGPAAAGGYQRARLDRVEELRRTHRDHWWLNQYDNPGNAAAYSSFARQITDQVGPIDCLVGSVGSGGSMCGTAKCLRQSLPGLHAIGVDTFGSVLFGLPDQPRVLRGLGNSILPANLDHTVFDEVHWVTAAEAYKSTRVLHQKTSLFAGGTSGAAWLVAQYWAKKNPDARVLCIFPDDGYRYMDTIYSDAYLSEAGLSGDVASERPRNVAHPLHAGPAWSSMAWMRRTYDDVMRTGDNVVKGI